MDTKEPDVDYDEMDGQLTLSGQGLYLRIQITPQELRSLHGVGAARWEDRMSIKAGITLGHPVFWCRSSDDRDAIAVLIGYDDETWELALELPAETVARVVSRP